MRIPFVVLEKLRKENCSIIKKNREKIVKKAFSSLIAGVFVIITVGLVFAGLLVPICMASIVACERPAFISLFTGSVPEDYAKHHHRICYEQVKEN